MERLTEAQRNKIKEEIWCNSLNQIKRYALALLDSLEDAEAEISRDDEELERLGEFYASVMCNKPGASLEGQIAAGIELRSELSERCLRLEDALKQFQRPSGHFDSDCDLALQDGELDCNNTCCKEAREALDGKIN